MKRISEFSCFYFLINLDSDNHSNSHFHVVSVSILILAFSIWSENLDRVSLQLVIDDVSSSLWGKSSVWRKTCLPTRIHAFFYVLKALVNPLLPMKKFLDQHLSLEILMRLCLNLRDIDGPKVDSRLLALYFCIDFSQP